LVTGIRHGVAVLTNQGKVVRPGTLLVITVAEARRILGPVGSHLSNEQLAARLGELSAIASGSSASRSPRRKWDAAGVEQKHRLQTFVVPTGLEWDGERSGTVTTGWFYSQLQPGMATEKGLVELTGFEPVTS
jgi:hypothetical protein